MTLWTTQSTEFSRSEYWSGWPFPSPEYLPNPGINPRFPALQVDSSPAEPRGKPSMHTAPFSSGAQSRPTLCDPMDRSTAGLPVHHQLPESTQTPVHRVGAAIRPSHPLSSPSPAFSLSRHQGLLLNYSSNVFHNQISSIKTSAAHRNGVREM